MHIQASTQFLYSVNYNKSVIAIAKNDCAADLEQKPCSQRNGLKTVYVRFSLVKEKGLHFIGISKPV
jgi:hypothetical protein